MTPADLRSTHFTLDTTAQLYSKVQLPRIFDPWARILLECVPCQPGDAVLDVATGPGTVARRAAVKVGPGGRVVGVDISPAMLSVARGWPATSGAAAIEYREGSGMSLPLPDAAFDVVYCQQGMQHMTDPLVALREMRRVLKPGGRLGLAAWTESPFGVFRRVLSEVVPEAGGHQPSDFGRDPGELSKALEQAGFSAIGIDEHSYLVEFEDEAEVRQLAEATSVGPTIAGLPADKRQAVNERILAVIRSFAKGGRIVMNSTSNIASARC